MQLTGILRNQYFACIFLILTACGASGAKEPEVPLGNQPSSPSAAPAARRTSSQSEPQAARSESERATASAVTRRSSVPLNYPRSQVSWLGVALGAELPQRVGVEVVQVFPNSPADFAGLQAGDILTRLGEVELHSPLQLGELVRASSPGREEPLAFERAGKVHLAQIIFEGTPDPEDRVRLALVGRPAPEIAGVVTFQGEASSLQEMEGEVVVLEFWASWCHACRALLPRLQEWDRQFVAQGVHLFGITVDRPSMGIEVARRWGMRHDLASDSVGQVSRLYYAQSIPLVVIIDRKGVVRDVMLGASEERLQELEALINGLAGEAA
ncbi:MAG: redoxin domain-containing protein [Polyangiaceae bacterium]|nr:redoxin domain-containing protein [Polyangiaceae bacterium]